jgi:multidrug resistance efflux pump
MDPVDLDDRIASQDAALKRAESGVLAAEAQVREASASKSYAENQASRYEQLLQAQSVSEEAVEGSVAVKVLHESNVPVLLIRPEACRI